MHEVIIVVAKYFVVIPAAVLAYVFIRSNHEQRKALVIFSLISVVSAFLLIKLAASVIHDPRPFVSEGVKPYFAHPADNGFPSDHTTFSALIALIVFRSSKKLGVALFLLAVMIGSARVVAGVHHGKDIVGGLIIAGLSFGVASLAFLLWPRLSKTQQ